MTECASVDLIFMMMMMMAFSEKISIYVKIGKFYIGNYCNYWNKFLCSIFLEFCNGKYIVCGKMVDEFVFLVFVHS